MNLNTVLTIYLKDLSKHFINIFLETLGQVNKMNPQDRKNLIRNSLEELMKKIEKGSHLAYLVLSGKKGEKYLQCSVSRDQQKILIDVPESALTDEEIKRIKAIISDITGEEALVGLQIEITANEAVDVIDRIFIEGFGFDKDYTLEINILE